MPKYTPGDDEMDASYAGAGPAMAEGEGGGEKAPAQSVDEEAAQGGDILIDKSKLPPGCKEGDTYTFRITKEYGDEVALELVKDNEPAAGDEEPMSQEASELAALSEGKA